jgi:peptidoglycan/LPS O-acetylase OafA/YrhL
MNYNGAYSLRLSKVITWLRLPLILFIILLHSYTVVRLEGNHDIYFKIVYPFSLWIGETGVPAFFFISGYLFFLSRKSYTQKLKNRFHSLFIPYFLWNAMLLVFYLAAYAAGYPQDINHRSIATFSFVDYLRLFWDRGTYDEGNFVPLLCPFWYIRNLLIMSLFSPILYYIIKYVREVFLISVLAWWLLTFNNAFIPQTILFFCLGAYFSIHNINPLELVSTNKLFFGSLFGLCAITDVAMHTGWHTSFALQAHRISLIFNIPALLLLSEFFLKKGFTNTALSSAAFIVFAVHYPIVVILGKFCVALFADASDNIHILLFFIRAIVTTFLSLCVYWLLNKYFPNIKNLLSGNR